MGSDTRGLKAVVLVTSEGQSLKRFSFLIHDVNPHSAQNPTSWWETLSFEENSLLQASLLEG